MRRAMGAVVLQSMPVLNHRKELMRRTQEASGGGKVALLLLSAPDGMDYYRKAGLEKFDNCFGIRRTKMNQDDDQGL